MFLQFTDSFMWSTQIINIVAGAIAVGALVITIRQKNTFFFDSRFFLAIANLAFIAVLGQEILTNFSVLPPNQVVSFSLTCLQLLAPGFASFLVQRTSSSLYGIKGFLGFLSRPPMKFLAYESTLLSWTVVAIVSRPFVLVPVSWAGEGTYYYSYSSWFGAFGLLVLAGFLLLPVLSLYSYSSHTRDPEASKSMRIISCSWASFGVLGFVGGFFPSFQGFFNEGNSFLLILIAYALREPTILSRIMVSSDPSSQSWIPLLGQDGDKVGLGGMQGFSGLLGLNHIDLLGRTILVEYDPSGKFEEIARAFAQEFTINNEPVAIFAALGSPVYMRLKTEEKARLFVLSMEASSPRKTADQQILLPERDANLLLDAVDKFLDPSGVQRGGFFLDLTDLVLSQGYERAHGIVTFLSELVESRSGTGFFAINPDVLDDKVLDQVKGLFKYVARFASGTLSLAPFGTIRTLAAANVR